MEIATPSLVCDPKHLAPMDSFMLYNSDINSFHQYEKPEEFTEVMNYLQQYERPLLCTEYMARGNESTFKDILPIMKENNIGAYNWGFVAGKSQPFILGTAGRKPTPLNLNSGIMIYFVLTVSLFDR